MEREAEMRETVLCSILLCCCVPSPSLHPLRSHWGAVLERGGKSAYLLINLFVPPPTKPCYKLAGSRNCQVFHFCNCQFAGNNAIGKSVSLFQIQQIITFLFMNFILCCSPETVPFSSFCCATFQLYTAQK